MIVVYDSLTGMGKRFASKLSLTAVDIKEVDYLPEKCILITRSFGFGQIPESTVNFLDKNHERVLGVAVSGNKNWGVLYGNAAKLIKERYDLPIITIFESSGFPNDVKIVQDYIDEVKNESNS